MNMQEGPYGRVDGYNQDGYPKDRVIRISAHLSPQRPDHPSAARRANRRTKSHRFSLVYLRSRQIWGHLEKPASQACRRWCPPEAGNRLMNRRVAQYSVLGHSKQG